MLLRALALTSIFALGWTMQSAEQSGERAAPEAKRICKRIVPTGTIVAKRFCLTRAEWAQFHDHTDKDVEQMRERKLRGGFDRRSSSF